VCILVMQQNIQGRLGVVYADISNNAVRPRCEVLLSWW